MALKSRGDYPEKEIEACRRVLIEIVNLLHEYKDNIALVGGWVPFFLVPQDRAPQHIGSLDVDLCFDNQRITTESYDSILNVLTGHGYVAREQPFQWMREVNFGDASSVQVPVDLLSAEYGGSGKKHRHQKIQEITARKARGSDLIFGPLDCYEEVILQGQLPGGAKDSARCKVAGVLPFLVMKGMALNRNKPKDAYDIEYVIANYPGGLDSLAPAFQSHLQNKLVKEGLGKIRAKFETVDHVGPEEVINFLEIEESEARQLRRRRAYEIVTAFLDALGIEKYV